MYVNYWGLEVIRTDSITLYCTVSNRNLQGLPQHLNRHPRVSEQNPLPQNMVWRTGEVSRPPGDPSREGPTPPRLPSTELTPPDPTEGGGVRYIGYVSFFAQPSLPTLVPKHCSKEPRAPEQELLDLLHTRSRPPAVFCIRIPSASQRDHWHRYRFQLIIWVLAAQASEFLLLSDMAC